MHLRRISSRNLWSCATWEILGHRYCISRRLSFARHKDPIHPRAIAYVGTDLDFSVILRIASILSADEYILLARSTSLPCKIVAQKNSQQNVSIKSKDTFDRKLCERTLTHLAKTISRNCRSIVESWFRAIVHSQFHGGTRDYQSSYRVKINKAIVFLRHELLAT